MEVCTRDIEALTDDVTITGQLLEVQERFRLIKESCDLDLAQDVLEDLKWIAESRRDSEAVRKAAKLYLSDFVIGAFTRYPKDVASEVLESLGWCIETTLDECVVNKYAIWMSDGSVGKLLDYVAGLNGSENVKMKRDILSILFVRWTETEAFDGYAKKVLGRRLGLEDKVELLALLRDMINVGRQDYADALVNGGLVRVRQMIYRDLTGLRDVRSLSSIKTAVRFLGDVKTMTSAEFLLKKCRESGSISRWIFTDPTTAAVIAMMKKSGLDVDFYVASGIQIAHSEADAHYTTDWRGSLASIVKSVTGSKANNTLPKFSIPGVSPGRLYHDIAKDYEDSINGSQASAERVLSTIKTEVLKNCTPSKLPRAAEEILSNIETLTKIMKYGGTVTFKGARVNAKVWERKLPNDLYDSEMLRCCIFLPNGEQKSEMPLFMMDPQTTLVHFYVQGLAEPVAAATFYAGTSRGEPAILMDTWEAGGLAYVAMPQSKMQAFALDVMIKFVRRSGAKKLLILATAEYGRPEEFCRFLKLQGFKSVDTVFSAFDRDDTILRTHSGEGTHHYTDAFKSGSLNGRLSAFIFDVGRSQNQV